MFYAGDAEVTADELHTLFGLVAVGQVPGGVMNELGLNLWVRSQETGKAGSIAWRICAGKSVSQLPLIQL